MSDEPGIVQVGDTDYYIWSDTYSWNVGKKVKSKPTKRSPRDYRMERVTYHGSLRQAVEEVFSRKLKVNVSQAKTMREIARKHAETIKWLKSLFPDPL